MNACATIPIIITSFNDLSVGLTQKLCGVTHAFSDKHCFYCGELGVIFRINHSPFISMNNKRTIGGSSTSQISSVTCEVFRCPSNQSCARWRSGKHQTAQVRAVGIHCQNYDGSAQRKQRADAGAKNRPCPTRLARASLHIAFSHRRSPADMAPHTGRDFLP